MPSFDFSAFLTQAAADARYQALSALGASTPATIVSDGAGTAGVATSGSRSDHNHPIVNDTPAATNVTGNVEGSSAGFARGDHGHIAPGTVGYAQVTANQTPITTETDVTGLAVTVTLVSGRRYRVSAMAQLASSASATFIGRIKEATTQYAEFQAGQTAIGNGCNTPPAVVLTCPGDITAGSHTFKMTAQVSGGTGSMFAGTANKAFILVEDIGV